MHAVEKSTLASVSKMEFGKGQLKDFDSSKDRLDEFYTSHLAEKKEFVDLFEVIKFVLVLSHGNAVVESGFSINLDVLVENLKEELAVAQRQVFYGIQSSGGISEVVITPSVMSCLEEKRGTKRGGKEKSSEKGGNAKKIKELKAKRSKLTAELQAEMRDIQKEIERLDKFSKS